MTKLKLVFAVFLSSLFMISCNPNDDNITNDSSSSNFSHNFGNEVERDFIGQVVNQQKHPIQYATVTIGYRVTKTDKNGIFIINHASVFEKFAHIKVTKVGYIDGSRSMVPTLGKNSVKIMMLSLGNTQVIHSGASGTVNLPNGTKVVFDGAFQDSYGRPYSGNISVDMFHLTPSDENLNILMPGMLYAEDKNGQEKGLKTFGMLHVDLYGDGGQKLQIAKNHKAEISIKIDDSQLSTAPSSIPLWHFDEEAGYWKEAGVAQRQGNLYVGEVSHFSWWNCDAPFPSVHLTVTVTDHNGVALSDLRVGLVRNDSLSSSDGTTDNNGQISGLVPANTPLTLNVYDYCNNIIHTSTIGPFSSDTILPNIVLGLNQYQHATITGHFLQCNGGNVTNGYIFFNNGNITRYASVINGVFNFDSSSCLSNTNFSLQGYDYDNLEQTNNTNFTMTGNNMDVGNLTSCTGINEYVSLKIDNNPAIIYREPIEALSVSKSGNGYVLMVGNGSTAGSLQLRIKANVSNLGTFTTPDYSISGNQVKTYSGNASSAVIFPNTLSFNLTQYGNVDDYVDLTVDGTITKPNGIIQTVHIVAHVLRDN